MAGSRTLRRFGFVLVSAGCLGWAVSSLAAQSSTPGATAGSVANPINCWWKTDKSSVRVAEPFGLTLTCRVMETDRAKVVPNFAEIEPTAIELTPFEVLEGMRHEDIVVPPWRYVQYVYNVRLIGDEFFGRDVAIPATNLPFRLQTGGAETVEGAEHTYLLPSMPIRILSLVPAQAADIVDPTTDSFADLEARRFRARIELVASAIFFGFSAVLAAVGAVRVSERFRKRGPVVEKTVPVRTVLAGCAREIDRVRADALRDGWTSTLAARALAPFRVAGAIALRQPVAQTLVAVDTPPRDGQLALRHGLLRRRQALVSASTTAEAIDRLRSTNNGGRPTDAGQDVVDPIREALASLNAVRYGRVGAIDVQALDRALDNGRRALHRLRIRRLWPARLTAALSKSTTSLGVGGWRS
jgi:hypothetical protein